MVDYLVREQSAAVVVRFNGGAQAAHNVVTPNGRHHTFSQFGSGTFVPGVKTHLSRFMLINPALLVQEAERLARHGITDAISRLTIDEQAIIITPYHQAANRIREMLRGDARHGTCGHGIGETVSDGLKYPYDRIRARDLSSRVVTIQILESIRDRMLAEFSDTPDSDALRTLEDPDLISDVAAFYEHFARSVNIAPSDYLGGLPVRENIIFEGAQGVLLDEWRGFHPYTTWSTTTFANADTLLDESGYVGDIVHLGVLRAYATRHGPGPFVTEDPAMSITEDHNKTNDWQRAFRVGPFDAVASRYAIEVAGRVDSLAITCLDRLPKDPRVAVKYVPKGRYSGWGPIERIYPMPHIDLEYQEWLTHLLERCTPRYETVTGDYVDYLETLLQVPVTITSHGPTALDKRRRNPLPYGKEALSDDRLSVSE
jgi:adenylosuccinate synthase